MDTSFQVVDNTEFNLNGINIELIDINVKLRAIDDIKRRINNLENDLKMNSFIKFKKDFYNTTNKIAKMQKSLENKIKNVENLRDEFLDLSNKVYKSETRNNEYTKNLLFLSFVSFFVIERLCNLFKF